MDELPTKLTEYLRKAGKLTIGVNGERLTGIIETHEGDYFTFKSPDVGNLPIKVRYESVAWASAPTK